MFQKSLYPLSRAWRKVVKCAYAAGFQPGVIVLSMIYFSSSEFRIEDINSTSYPPPFYLCSNKFLQIRMVTNNISFGVRELLNNIQPHFQILPCCSTLTINFQIKNFQNFFISQLIITITLAYNIAETKDSPK